MRFVNKIIYIEQKTTRQICRFKKFFIYGFNYLKTNSLLRTWLKIKKMILQKISIPFLIMITCFFSTTTKIVISIKNSQIAANYFLTNINYNNSS